MTQAEGSNVFSVFMGIMNTVAHLLIGSVTIVSCLFAYLVNGSDNFRQHVVLCVIGYTLIMGQNILALAKHNSWSSSLSYRDKNYAHRFLGVVGSILAIMGSIIRIQGTNATFSTPHGILGWLAMILTFVNLLCGVISIFVSPKQFIRAGHILFGVTAYTLAMASLCYGYKKNSFLNATSEPIVTTMIFITSLATFATLFPALTTLKRKLFKF